MDPTSIAIAIGAIVAALFAFFARENGKKVGERKGIEIGKSQAVNEIAAQSTEQSLERISAASEAGAVVERRTADGVRDATREDPNNRGRVQRP